MTGTATERRNAARYQVPAPIIFKSASQDQSQNPESGFVQDISTEGVLVWSPFEARVRERTELEILLPPLPKSDKKFALRSTGVVVRESPDGFAVAAKFILWRLTKIGARLSCPENRRSARWVQSDDKSGSLQKKLDTSRHRKEST
jgi:hypothetical protein